MDRQPNDRKRPDPPTTAAPAAKRPKQVKEPKPHVNQPPTKLNAPHRDLSRKILQYLSKEASCKVHDAKFVLDNCREAVQRQRQRKPPKHLLAALAEAERNHKRAVEDKNVDSQVHEETAKSFASKWMATMAVVWRSASSPLDPPLDPTAATQLHTAITEYNKPSPANGEKKTPFNLLDFLLVVADPSLELAIAVSLCLIEDFNDHDVPINPAAQPGVACILTKVAAIYAVADTAGRAHDVLVPELQQQFEQFAESVADQYVTDTLKNATDMLKMHKDVKKYVNGVDFSELPIATPAQVEALVRGVDPWTQSVLVKESAHALGMAGVDQPTSAQSLMTSVQSLFEAIDKAAGERTMVELLDGITSSHFQTSWRTFKGLFGLSVRARPMNQLSAKLDKVKDYLDKYVPTSIREHAFVACGTHGARDLGTVDAFAICTAAGAWTDFHRDFAGTGVFYHVVSGSKVFFTAPDTEQNIEWYKEKEENQLTVFTTTRKPVGVKKFQINQGTTVFLCPGVLHAVYTPSDAVVVAGNFISLAHAQRHVEIVKLEDSFKLSDNGAVIDLPVFPAIVAKGVSRAKLDPMMPKELAGFDVLVKWLLDWISSKELADADGKIKSLCDAVDKGARRDQQRCIKSLLPIVFARVERDLVTER